MERPSLTHSLKVALSSWRIGSLSLLSISSGLPLGLVLTAVPAWMAMVQVDIKTIGVLTLVQAPYAFKFVWAPLLDALPLARLGRRRGWILLFQLVLACATGVLAATATSPPVGAVAALTLLIAFASASQDIVIDAYAVESLRKEEQGLAVGARTAMYRAGMWMAGNIAISLAPLWGWSWTLLAQAVVYLALVPVTLLAPEPDLPAPPPRSLREAVWAPFVGFFQQSRALEIASFLLLYKLADNLAGALVRPFLVQKGYDALDVGVASGTMGLAATLAGTFLGGLFTTRLGVGRALWVFGFLQAISNLGYAAVAQYEVNRALMYSAIAIESGTTGMGTGAFSVLLLQLTQKRFSATQFALFSSIFALGRTIVGPPAGAIVDAIGWQDFFLFTIPCALPGMWMLQRFAPWHQRELPEASHAPSPGLLRPMSQWQVLALGSGAALGAGWVGLMGNALLTALKNARAGVGFDVLTPLWRSLQPASLAEALDLIGATVFGLVVGFGVAAYLAARRGMESSST